MQSALRARGREFLESSELAGERNSFKSAFRRLNDDDVGPRRLQNGQQLEREGLPMIHICPNQSWANLSSGSVRLNQIIVRARSNLDPFHHSHLLAGRSLCSEARCGALSR